MTLLRASFLRRLSSVISLASAEDSDDIHQPASYFKQYCELFNDSNKALILSSGDIYVSNRITQKCDKLESPAYNSSSK